VLTVVTLVGAASVWLLTIPGGPRAHDTGGDAGRWAMRILSLCPVAAAARLFVASTALPYTIYDRLERLIPLVLLAAPPLALLVFLRLRHLAIRMFNPSLYVRSLIVGVGLCAGASVPALLPLLELYEAVLGPVASISLLTGFASGLYAVLILTRFIRAFLGVRRHALEKQPAANPSSASASSSKATGAAGSGLVAARERRADV
jgi:hypothetical protein